MKWAPVSKGCRQTGDHIRRVPNQMGTHIKWVPVSSGFSYQAHARIKRMALSNVCPYQIDDRNIRGPYQTSAIPTENKNSHTVVRSNIPVTGWNLRLAV